MRWTGLAALSSALLIALGGTVGCSGSTAQSSDQNLTQLDPEDAAEGDYYEGVEADQTPDFDPESGGDLTGYDIPLESDLPKLENPEIIISLTKPLVAHLFDRDTGFSAVYPVGPGKLGSNGVSVTPAGHFTVGSRDVTDSWYWIKRRTDPDYFAGLPFLRLSIKSSSGAQTYGMHGPITDVLKNDYVSHGCVRMAADDVIQVFWMSYYRGQRKGTSASTIPVSIVPGQNLDRSGNVLSPGSSADVWAPGDSIDWASMGAAPRPSSLDPAWGH